MKVNVDAMVGESKSIISVVARDCRGELVSCLHQMGKHRPLSAKVEALRWATSLVMQLPFESTCIEGLQSVTI